MGAGEAVGETAGEAVGSAAALKVALMVTSCAGMVRDFAFVISVSVPPSGL